MGKVAIFFFLVFIFYFFFRFFSSACSFILIKLLSPHFVSMNQRRDSLIYHVCLIAYACSLQSARNVSRQGPTWTPRASFLATPQSATLPIFAEPTLALSPDLLGQHYFVSERLSSWRKSKLRKRLLLTRSFNPVNIHPHRSTRLWRNDFVSDALQIVKRSKMNY